MIVYFVARYEEYDVRIFCVWNAPEEDKIFWILGLLKEIRMNP